ncbi:MAG: efflux RND transporter periplasmic adaptor subunit [Phycisphaerae bacterium]
MTDKKHKAIRLAGAAGIVLLLAVGGWLLWKYVFQPDDQTGTLVLYGNVDIREVELAFYNTERIDELLVEEGDAVSQGQLLGKLDTSRLLAAVNRAEATADARKEELARLEAGSRPQEIDRAEAELELAKAERYQAQTQLQRTRAALEGNAASPQEIDNARAAYEAAVARVRVAEENLQLARLGPRNEDIAAARAQLRAARADVKLLQEQLADASLHAPSDGVIRDRILEPGDMASPEKPAFLLAVTSPVWIRTYVSETNLGKIWPGMDATITTDSFPDKSYQGWVGFISPTAEFTPKTVQTPELRTALVYRVRIYVKDPQNQLRLGMPATVTLDLTQPQRNLDQSVHPAGMNATAEDSGKTGQQESSP